jgi:hypothetical protein
MRKIQREDADQSTGAGKQSPKVGDRQAGW